MADQEIQYINLFHNVHIPKHEVRDVMMGFYHEIKDPVFDDVVKRICQVSGALSNLNLPLLLNREILGPRWETTLYREKFLESISDLKESIKNGFAVGVVKKFCKCNAISETWLLTGAEDGDDAPAEDGEPSFLDLAAMTGDFSRAHTGEKTNLIGRKHEEVILPSTDKLLEEMGGSVSALEIMEEIENQTILSDVVNGTPTLPDVSNQSGHKPFNAEGLISTNIRPNFQPLPKSKTANGIDEILHTREQKTHPDYDIEKCIAYLSNTLPEGTTITITGSRKKG